MAYLSTDISNPTTPTTQPPPQLNEYTSPDVAITKPELDSSNIGYQAPATNFNARSIDSGLLDYDPTAAQNLTFDGREIDASAVGANISQQTPDFATSNNFLSDGAFVENRVAGLLEDPNNTLNQRMKANGLADSNSRGLANTSMGATIGQAVLADNAIRIATPDATTQATGDLNRQGATYDAQGKIQTGEIQSSLAEQTAKINSSLEAQRAGQSWDSTAQKAVIQGALNTQNANISGAQTTQQEGYTSDARNQQAAIDGAGREQSARISGELAGLESMSSQNLSILQNKLESANRTTQEQNAAIMQQYSEQQALIRDSMNNQFNMASTQAQLNAGQRDSLANVMGEMAYNYELTVQNIMLDPNLDADAKNAAILRINKIFDQDMNNISQVFGATYEDTEA
jgi:hypothetical protein